MADMLMEFTQNDAVRSVIKATGLPIPVPPQLDRLSGPAVEKPLAGKKVLLAGNGQLGAIAGQTIAAMGASPVVTRNEARGLFDGGIEPTVCTGPEEIADGRVHGIVFDATSVSSPEGLRALYDGLHGWVRSIGASGRIVVLARPHDDASSFSEASARRAIEGFTRSLAKEIGGKGATANLIVVDQNVENRVPAVMRFLLSPASAFVTAQPIRVSGWAKSGEGAPVVGALAGKVALVTGAGRGIGEKTAEILAGEGAHVVCLERPEDAALVREVAKRIGGSALAVDVCDAGAGKEIAAALKEKHGGVDIVVHNAGITRDKTLARMKPEGWDTVIGVNLVAVDNLTSALLDGALRDGGRIVCLSSVAGIAGNMGQTNYGASKAGIIGFVEYLSKQVAYRGITVNAVAPGFIETRMTDAIPFVIREGARRMCALGQGGQPEDVAQAITFLSTPGASGVTGRILRVCGGALIGA